MDGINRKCLFSREIQSIYRFLQSFSEDYQNSGNLFFHQYPPAIVSRTIFRSLSFIILRQPQLQLILFGNRRTFPPTPLTPTRRQSLPRYFRLLSMYEEKRVKLAPGSTPQLLENNLLE